MRTLGFILLFVVTAIATVAGALLPLPWLKEGFEMGMAPVFFGVGLVLGAIAIAWMRAPVPVWARVLIVTGVMLASLLNLFNAGAMAFNWIAARVLETTAVVVSYEETPITWPGFDGPVGITARTVLEHPPWLPGVVSTLMLYRGPVLPTESYPYPYLRYGADRGNAIGLPALGYVLSATNRQKRAHLGKNGQTVAEEALYPMAVSWLESEDKICLHAGTRGIPVCAAGAKPADGCRSPNHAALEPRYGLGDQMTARRYVYLPYGARADLTPAMTAAARKNSSLLAAPDAWTAIHRNLEPAGLKKAGYGLCPSGNRSHGAGRVCYCR